MGQRLAVLQHKTVRQPQPIADDGVVICGLGAMLCASHRLWLCGVLCDDSACASSEEEHEVVEGSQGKDRFGADGGWYGPMLPKVAHGCQERRGKAMLFFSHAMSHFAIPVSQCVTFLLVRTLSDVEELLEPTERGDPESPLRWTTKRVRHLARRLPPMSIRTLRLGLPRP